MIRTIGRRAVGCVSAALAIWALLPLASGVVNIGVFLPAVIGIGGAVWGAMPPPDRQKGWRRGMMIAITALICAAAVLGGVIIGLMASAASRRPTDTPATVVVLGAGIRRDESPSRMLRDRLDSACVYLREHPQAVCVVTGGQGSDEPCTEAAVMARYLQAQGIDPARIRLEERATSTHENMEYTMALIRAEGLPTDIVVATQEFHQYRAAQLARMAGAGAVSALTSASPPHLLLCYWVRECAAICRLWLTGY